ncbi:MAG: D-alanyl-D-alanine carboxypeptidase/D-alanyl-D-alanine-endopeptidase [Bacteroidota bacterium]
MLPATLLLSSSVASHYQSRLQRDTSSSCSLFNMKYTKYKSAISIKRLLIIHFSLLIILSSCSINKQISRSATEEVINNKALQAAHVGISLFDPAANKYLYNYQGDKYFVPASNVKIPTCYAAMKYLGDSLVGARVLEQSGDLIILPAGDPTFINHEFKFQPLLSLLKEKGNSIIIRFSAWQDAKWGSGWTWNDYQEAYMVEKSAMPLYGNLVNFLNVDDSAMAAMGNQDRPKYISYPKLFSASRFWEKSKYNFSEVSADMTLAEMQSQVTMGKSIGFKAGRVLGFNLFYVKPTLEPSKIQSIPFVTSGDLTNELLNDTLHKSLIKENLYFTGDEQINKEHFKVIHSQPTDSLLKPMMHRSDNFFAEQSLLMVSNEMLGVMNDEKIIDTLLKTDFKDLPQKPRWADGSGLSRYNLFTPQSLIAILNKMKNEFGMERIKEIFPTGGEGTISSYYKADSGYIYAKTGTLSGVVAFSGFLYTKKGKLLIFSTLVNNHHSSATAVRRAIEKFIQNIRNKY